MFMQALDCSNHILSKLASWRDDRYDIAEDATISFMTKIKYGVKDSCGRRGKNSKLKEFNPKSISTMLRYECIGILYNDKTKFNDNIISLDEYYENKQE